MAAAHAPLAALLLLLGLACMGLGVGAQTTNYDPDSSPDVDHIQPTLMLGGGGTYNNVTGFSYWNSCTNGMRIVDRICLHGGFYLDAITLKWLPANASDNFPRTAYVGGNGGVDGPACLELDVEHNERITLVEVWSSTAIHRVRITTNAGQTIDRGGQQDGSGGINTNFSNSQATTYQVGSGFLCGISGTYGQAPSLTMPWNILLTLQFNFLQTVTGGALTNLQWTADNYDNTQGSSSEGSLVAGPLSCSGPGASAGTKTIAYSVKKTTTIMASNTQTFGASLTDSFSVSVEEEEGVKDVASVSTTVIMGMSTTYTASNSDTTSTTSSTGVGITESTVVDLSCPTSLTQGITSYCTWTFKNSMDLKWEGATYTGLIVYQLASGHSISIPTSGQTTGSYLSDSFGLAEPPNCSSTFPTTSLLSLEPAASRRLSAPAQVTTATMQPRSQWGSHAPPATLPTTCNPNTAYLTVPLREFCTGVGRDGAFPDPYTPGGHYQCQSRLGRMPESLSYACCPPGQLFDGTACINVTGIADKAAYLSLPAVQDVLRSGAVCLAIDGMPAADQLPVCTGREAKATVAVAARSSSISTHQAAHKPMSGFWSVGMRSCPAAERACKSVYAVPVCTSMVGKGVWGSVAKPPFPTAASDSLTADIVKCA